MLDDPIGASLALNRIGVAYYKCKKYQKSMRFHLKHQEFTDKENAFAAYYNLGICNRLLGQYIQSVDYFKKALEWAQFREVSIC
jgi:tetratricopeptide (TPR) repeat protein